MSDYLNPFSDSAVDLNKYVQAARPQVARMLGMNPTPQQPPQSGPGVNFSQSFGDLPSSSDAAKAAFLAKYLKSQQGLTPPAPQEGSPNVWQGPAQFAGPTNTSGDVTPQPNSTGFSNDIIGRLAKMGSNSGSGLIPKFAYLAGLGQQS
jgi:hypothetical protein